MESERCTRVEWIDFAKCIAILLVIIGHILSWSHPQYKAVYIAIYSMHMPFFFMLSGLTFSVKKEETVSKFIKRKAKTIFPPLFLFCGIEVFFQVLFENLLSRLSVKFVIESLLFMNGGAFSKYWFLPALFVAEIILFGVFRLFDNLKCRTFVTALIGLGGGTLSYYLNYHLPLHFESAVFAVLFIYSGILIKKIILGKSVREKSAICIGTGLVFVITNIVMLPRYDITDDVFSMTFRNPILFLITAFSGSICLLILCSTQDKKSIFTEIGRQTLYIYGFHYSIFGILRRVEFKILHLQNYLPDSALALIEFTVTLVTAYFCAKVWLYILSSKRHTAENERLQR